jgi:hypothetical protein
LGLKPSKPKKRRSKSIPMSFSKKAFGKTRMGFLLSIAANVDLKTKNRKLVHSLALAFYDMLSNSARRVLETNLIKKSAQIREPEFTQKLRR